LFRISRGFEDDFAVELDDDALKTTGEAILSESLAFNRDGDEESQIALNVFPLVASSSGNGPDPRMARMLSQLRLLKASINGGTEGEGMEDILALLSCPVVMPDEANYHKFEILSTVERTAICRALFFCLNWFREIINAFNDQKDEDIRQKIIWRIRDILDLSDTLRDCLACHPLFVPPPVIHTVTLANGWQPPGSRGGQAAKGKGKAIKKSRGKKRKSDESLHPTQIEDEVNCHDMRGGAKVNLSSYAPFLRELDMNILSILSYDVVTVDPDEGDAPRLRPQDLAFLLQDILAKLTHSLKGSQRTPFNREGGAAEAAFARLNEVTSVEVVRQIVDMLEYLLGQLDSVQDYAKIISSNLDTSNPDPEAVAAASSITVEKKRALAECQGLILSCLGIVFSWNGFLARGHFELLKRALLICAKYEWTVTYIPRTTFFKHVNLSYLLGEKASTFPLRKLAQSWLPLLLITLKILERTWRSTRAALLLIFDS